MYRDNGHLSPEFATTLCNVVGGADSEPIVVQYTLLLSRLTNRVEPRKMFFFSVHAPSGGHAAISKRTVVTLSIGREGKSKLNGRGSMV